MTIMLEIEHLDCSNLTAKQAEDLATAYADDIVTSMGRGPGGRIFSLSGEASQVSLRPLQTSPSTDCRVECLMTVPEGSTLQAIAKEQNVAMLQELLQGSAILANADGASLQIVQMTMLPTSGIATTMPTMPTMPTSGAALATPVTVPVTTTGVAAGVSSIAAPTSQLAAKRRHHFDGRTGFTLLVTFLCLAACLCCVELWHVVWKRRGRRLMSRWLKTGPSDPENSETESSSSDNGETGSTSHRL